MPTSFAVLDDDLSFFFGKVLPHLDERQRKIVTGAAARALGRGGVRAVAVASGLSLSTVQQGALAVDAGIDPSDRIRAPGAGRPRAVKSLPGLVKALDALVEPAIRGDPECALRWTTRSTRGLADDLTRQGLGVTHSVVAKLLADMGYSLRVARKPAEGGDHPDRDAQFRYLAGLVQQFRAAGEPVISVDEKKRRLIGNFVPAGQQRIPAGRPVETKTQHFPDEEPGKAVPREMYDAVGDGGWVSVGGGSDTVVFAVSTIRQWWNDVGSAVYPEANKLLITVDSGGSKSSRGRLWKREIAAFAEDAGLDVTVCHFPPGTSKWNNIEYRLSSHISMSRHGRVLESREVMLSLIAGTASRSGPTIGSERDLAICRRGTKVADHEMKLIPLVKHNFHGDWNYTIKKSMDEADRSVY